MRGGVLVVEDDADLVALLETIVLEAGWPVRTARDGQAALERVAEGMPDLVLLDMRMPIMDGWAFAAAFRERYGRAAPIVVVTAAENARDRAEEIGAEDWLAKPFDLDEVIRKIERHLGPAPGSAQPSP